jgi:hypothetical protein
MKARIVDKAPFEDLPKRFSLVLSERYDVVYRRHICDYAAVLIGKWFG